MRYGLNVNPRHVGVADPDPADVRAWGFDFVRFVSHWECDAYARACHQVGLQVLPIILRESNGHFCEGTAYQIGNEFEAGGNDPSSERMTDDAFVAFWEDMAALASIIRPGVPLIGPGLVSGDVDRWRNVAHRLPRLAATAVHPYTLSVAEAEAKLDAYHSVRPDLPLVATEWNNRPVADFARMLDRKAALSAWFGANDAMKAGHGLFTDQGEAKPEFYALKEVLNMATLNDAHGAAYKLANPEVAFNPDAAIAKKWLALKQEGVFIGVPIGPEMDIGNGQRAQSFTSGAVLVWKGGNVVEVV